MAVNLGELNVELGVDSSGLTRGMRDVRTLSDDLSRTFTRLAAAAAAAFSIDAARRVSLLADNMKILDIRIKQATKSNDEYIRSQQKLIQISKNTGLALESSLKLFESLKISADEVGANNEQVLRLTESLQKLGVTGGASAEQMSNAMMQFGQAMAGGIVRAEEWNSILENTPAIAKAIADGLNTSVGQLRLMVNDGKLLAEDVFNSLLKQTDAIDRKFAKFPTSINAASNALSISFGQAIKEIDENLGFTDAIIKSIQELDKVISEDLVDSIFTVSNFFTKIGDASDQIIQRWQLFNRAVDSTSGPLDTVKNIIGFILDSIVKIPNNLGALFTVAIGWLDRLKINVVAFFDLWDLERDKLRQNMDTTLANIAITFKAKFFRAIDAIRRKLGEALDLGSGALEFLGFENIDETVKSLKSASQSTKELTEQAKQNLAVRDIELALIEETIVQVKKERDEKIQASHDATQSAIDDAVRLNQALDDASFERIQSYKDEQAAIEAERKRIAENSEGAVPLLEKKQREISDKEKAAAKKASDDKLAQQKTQAQIERNAVLGSAEALSSDLLALMEQSGKEQTALSRALFIANKAVQVASIINNTLAGASVHAANPALAGFITATGFAQAGIVAGSTIAGAGRQHGGIVGGNMMTPINENGEPEMLVQGSKQFLLTGSRGGRVTSANDMRVGGSGSAPNIVINNNAPGVTVSAQSVTMDEVMILVEESQKSAVNEVNTSLATGRGTTSSALQSSFNITRRR